MNKNKRNVTIVVNPTYEGIAFVAYESMNNILDFGLKKVHRKNKHDFSTKAKYLFEYCEPEIVLLVNKEYQKSERITWAIDEIKRLALELRLTIHSRTHQSISEVFEVFGVKTKYERSKLLCSWFPMLNSIAPRQQFRFIKSDYHTPVFDAFALMIAHEDWKMAEVSY